MKKELKCEINGVPSEVATQNRAKIHSFLINEIPDLGRQIINDVFDQNEVSTLIDQPNEKNNELLGNMLNVFRNIITFHWRDISNNSQNDLDNSVYKKQLESLKNDIGEDSDTLIHQIWDLVGKFIIASIEKIMNSEYFMSAVQTNSRSSRNVRKEVKHETK